jgi:xylulokinase
MITNHAEQGKWLLEGYQAAAASVFRWFKEELSAAETSRATAEGSNAYDLICERAKAVAPGAKGLVFLPYFAGAATPRYDAEARGVMAGLTFSHDRACFARAIMEGITMDMRDMITAIRAAGAVVDTVRLLGGPTKSGLWNQIQADAFGTIVQTLKIGDATVLGAAVMGGVGAGIFGSLTEGAEAMVQVDKTYEPDQANARLYDELYGAWIATYEGLSGSGAFSRIAALQRQ